MAKPIKDSAVILPLIGLVLFIPPFIQIFDVGGSIFGIPIFLAGITLVWVLGIALTALVSRRLLKSDFDRDD